MPVRRQLRFDRGLQVRMLLTVALLGALYIVFIAILVAVGVGVVGVALIAALLFLLQYFTCDGLALAAMHAKRVTAHEAPELHATVVRLCSEAGVPMVRLAVVETPLANAFAVGRTPSTATIGVTHGLLSLLDESELEGVLAHELTHVINRDVMLMTFAGVFAPIAAFIARLRIFPAGAEGADDEDGPAFLVMILSGMVYVLSFALFQALSRYREFAADRGSALLTGRPGALSSALQRISGQMEEIPPRDLRGASGELGAFCIVSPTLRTSVAPLFSTHPPLADRIQALGRLEAQLQTA